MIEKCSIGNMNNNLQNITLIILILILIIVILFYIRNSSLKHDELVEKYTTISTNVINRTPDISHNGPSPDTNRLSFFSTSGTAVTLRPCQVKFNNDGSSKYEYQDDWQEIGMLDGGEVPVKVIGRDNTTNASDITNFSEKSRCFKELSSTDTYKYKYLNNDLIQYDKNNYVSLTSNINGVPVAKNYMEMKFDVFGSNINHFDNIRNSICSLNYSKTLRSEDNSSTLGNTELYRLKLTNDRDNKIENIEKITIDPADNHVFNKNTSFEVANLIGANTGIYKYDTASKLFVFEPRNASVSNDIRTINLYQFERNLFCDKQEIKSYKKLNNAKIDMIKIINYDMPPPTFFPDTKIPDRYLTSTYISNIRKENSLTEVKGYLNDLITNELNILNTATSNILQDKRDANTILINQRTAFIEPSNNSKGKFIQNAIIKNNYDDDKNKYKLLLSKDYYDLGFGDVTYSSYTINEGHSSIVVNSGDEPILKEFVSETGSGTQDVWEVKIFKENDTFILPVNTTGDILIVGGGGGGGKAHGGGGGAGSLIYLTNVSLNAGTYTINVGKGGAGAILRDGPVGGGPNNGTDSSIFYNGTNIYLAKGGGGGRSAIGDGASGGSGGGGNGATGNSIAAGGAALTTNIPSGSYGNSGGSGKFDDGGNLNDWSGGGGGGANEIGGSATVSNKVLRAGNGGNGRLINITGTGTYYAGGGGGGCIVANKNNNTVAGSGGLGGGGNGGSGGSVVNGTNASNNTGSGGGGGGRQHDTDIDGNGGAGGSGIVIIRYKKIAVPIDNNVRKKITLEYKEKSYIREFRHSGGTENQTIYEGNNGLVLPAKATADILMIGGGGSGGGNGQGGGGGAGSVIYYEGLILNGTYNIKIGKGADATLNQNIGDNGKDSEFLKIDNTQRFLAKGGGGGGTYNASGYLPRAGGSGGGGAGNSAGATIVSGNIINSVSVNISNDNYINTGFTGNRGINSLNDTGCFGNKGGTETSGGDDSIGAGGGGAGEFGFSTIENLSGNQDIAGNGGSGKKYNITGIEKYYGGGGGGGLRPYPANGTAHGSTSIIGSGGNGGGGNGGGGVSISSNGFDAENGTGGGGGGVGGYASANFRGGKGGSGIVIIRYKYTNDNQRYSLNFPRRTNVKFIINGFSWQDDKSFSFVGEFIITITSTNTIIQKVGAPDKLDIPSNKIEIIYELFDTLDNINSTFTDSLTTTKSNPINVYNNTLSLINNGFQFQPNKYNKYKISGFIPKANKKGDNDIDFNIVLIIRDPKDSSRLIDMSKDLYSIRYVFQSFVSANEITPIDIYITIKPLPDVNKDTIYYSYFAFKTYSRSSGSGLNSSEIQVFLSNRSKTTSINSFNNISDWITDLSNKNIWGLSTMDTEISDIIRNLLSEDNIDNKCKNDNTANDLRICDIQKLIYIKNNIKTVTNTSSPSLIQNVSSVNVFPRNSPYVNFNIDDYISYESSTLIAPQQRTTTFDIKSTATKYMYFYMGAVS